MSDLSQILDLLYNDFVPNEPVLRSLGIYTGDERYERSNKKDMSRFMKKNIKAQAIVVARNESEKVVGMMIGHQVKKGAKGEMDPTFLGFMNNYASWMMSRKMNNACQFFEKMIRELRYFPKWIMEDFDCKNIFIGDMMSVDKSVRGLRLGSILLQQSMQVAKEMGCELYVSACTSNYSQKIYKDLVRQMSKLYNITRKNYW
jgi:hypothetical protein